MTPYEAYQMFLGIKMHFTQPSYDYFRYNGRVNATIDSFNRRRDKYQFAKLGRHKDPYHYLIAQYSSGNFTGWVGDLFTEEAEREYRAYLARRQSLTYNFKSDLGIIGENFVSKFKVKDGQHPEALVMFRRGDISIETLAILNKLLKFFPFWDTRIDDTIIWPSTRDRVIKYTPFIEYDKVKIKSLIQDRMV